MTARDATWESFNMNHTVRVKLNQRGLDILKAQYDELRARFPKLAEWRAPATDADGWSEHQLWCLMRDFGDNINIGMNAPFETEIQFQTTRSEIAPSRNDVIEECAKRAETLLTGWEDKTYGTILAEELRGLKETTPSATRPIGPATAAHDATVRDAVRYRWLRLHFRFANDSMRELWFDSSIQHSALKNQSGDELDRAIDQEASGKRVDDE